MNDLIPPETPGGSRPPSEPDDWREERRRRYEERRAARGGGAWIGGAILVVLGVVFLLRNLSGFELDNWWALFILIPAISLLGQGWRGYRLDGRLTAASRGSLLGGMLLTLIAFAFLLEFTSTLFWPVLLIILGLGILLNVILPG